MGIDEIKAPGWRWRPDETVEKQVKEIGSGLKPGW